MIKYIFIGFFNLILSKFYNLKYKKLFNERLNICLNCEFRNNNKCSICGCFLIAKTKVNYPLDENKKSIGGCPLNPPKW